MTFEIIAILSLVVLTVVREVIHYLQVAKLQELLKSSDITEYYKAKGITKTESPSKNVVMEETNDITQNEDDFDIRKISEVVVDGQVRPINIIE